MRKLSGYAGLAIITISVLALPVVSHAACTSASGNGNWDLYAFGRSGWFRCAGSLASGRVSGSCLSNTGARSLIDGKLTISSNCRLAGSFTQTYNNSTKVTLTVPQATLGAGNAMIAGVGSASNGDTFELQAVRR
jgi:hypothetical protein